MIKVSQITTYTDGETVVLTHTLQIFLFATPFYTHILRERGTFVKRKFTADGSPLQDTARTSLHARA